MVGGHEWMLEGISAGAVVWGCGRLLERPSGGAVAPPVGRDWRRLACIIDQGGCTCAVPAHGLKWNTAVVLRGLPHVWAIACTSTVPCCFLTKWVKGDLVLMELLLIDLRRAMIVIKWPRCTLDDTR